MGRNIRIEYEGAYYHVMARGNHRGAIFLDDNDRDGFLTTLEESCEKTGWGVHAWVLMDNHYHLFIKTPEANLVEGMKWLQNSYTRRFNVRHKEWGPLFGDRYKAILVEGKSNYYYETILDYIHLNPVRAGLIDFRKKQGLLDYQWSSLVGGYALPFSKRRKGFVCSEGLKAFGFSDTPEGREKMIARLERMAIAEDMNRCGIPSTSPEIDKRYSNLRRGWYWGTQQFSEEILAVANDVLRQKRSSAYRSAPEQKEHGLRQATVWLEEGLKRAGLEKENLHSLSGSDPRKIFLALFLRKKTTVSNSWLAEHLKMKSPGNVSHRLCNSDMKKISKKLPQDLIDYAKAQKFEI